METLVVPALDIREVLVFVERFNFNATLDRNESSFTVEAGEDKVRLAILGLDLLVCPLLAVRKDIDALVVS